MAGAERRNVVLVLARELAVNLATPMWVWDEKGELVYYNDHVEEILGGSENEIGVERVNELPRFEPEDLDGNPLPMHELPSVLAIQKHIPAHRDMRIVGLDGAKRSLSVTAFPLFARGAGFVGAMAVFWELVN